MVIVNSFAVRKNTAGESFVALILTGEPEMVRSVKTGKFYCTVRKCSIPSTVDEKTAQMLVGSKMTGQIVRKLCPEYEYTTSTGEKIMLDFQYEYQDTSQNVEEKLFS